MSGLHLFELWRVPQVICVFGYEDDLDQGIKNQSAARGDMVSLNLYITVATFKKRLDTYFNTSPRLDMSTLEWNSKFAHLSLT